MILQGCPLLDRHATCVDWLNTAWAPEADVVICSVHTRGSFLPHQYFIPVATTGTRGVPSYGPISGRGT
jgi:hypothetical protein